MKHCLFAERLVAPSFQIATHQPLPTKSRLSNHDSNGDAFHKPRGRSIEPPLQLYWLTQDKKRRASSVPVAQESCPSIDDIGTDALDLSIGRQDLGQRFAHRHITDMTDEHERIADSADFSLEISLEMFDNEDGDENEGYDREVTSVPKFKQHITEQTLSCLTAAAGSVGYISWNFTDICERDAYGDVHGYAQQQQRSFGTQQPAEPWGLRSLYPKGPLEQESLESLQPVLAPPASLESPMGKRATPSGPVATNRLGNSGANLSSISRLPVFDLANSRYNSRGNTGEPLSERPSKRRRVDEDPERSNESSATIVITDDDESPKARSIGHNIMLRHGKQKFQAQPRYSHSFGKPMEYKDVEGTLREELRKRPPRQSGSCSESTRSQLTGSSAAAKLNGTKQTGSTVTSPHDHIDDPIEEVDSDQPPSRKIPKSASTLQVQISATLRKSVSIDRLKSEYKRDNASTFMRHSMKNGERFHYLPLSNGNAKESDPRGLSDTSDVEETTQNGHLSTVMPPPERLLRNKGAKASAKAYEDESSIDDLMKEHYKLPAQQVANRLLAKRDKSVTVKVADDSESSDELNEVGANILPQNFGHRTANPAKSQQFLVTKPSKKRVQKRLEQDQYSIVEIFSENKKWLIDPIEKPWYLMHKPQGRVLSIHDDVQGYQFDIMTNSIQYIEMDTELLSSKIIIHKSKDLASRNGHMIFMEFGDLGGQSGDFRDRFEKFESTITFRHKDKEKLDKIFTVNRHKQPESKQRKPLRSEEAVDLQLAKRNQQRRTKTLFDQAAENSRRRTHANSVKEDGREMKRAEGMAKRMEASRKETKDHIEKILGHNSVPEISPRHFYDSSEPAELTQPRRTSNRIKKGSPRRLRTPSPTLTWTQLDPSWEDGWTGSVNFAGVGKARASVEISDIPKLDEGEFLNDNLIYFYLLYLEKQLFDANQNLADRIYVQNTFFYERLTNQEKGKRGSSINYEAVRKWTARAHVDIFKKDYIIIPVNENLHWWVAIICNAPKLLNPESEAVESRSQGSNVKSEGIIEKSQIGPRKETEESGVPHFEVDARFDKLSLDDASSRGQSKEPVASTQNELGKVEHSCEIENATRVDSEPLNEAGLQELDDSVALVQSDLKISSKKASKGKGKRSSMGRRYDPKEPRIITLDSFGYPHSPACTNLKEYLIAELKSKHDKEIPPPGSLGMTAKGVPKQDNYCDCGVFMLGYMEKFFEDPDDFTYGILQGREDVDKKDWINAPQMRNDIRDLLFDLMIQQAPEKKRAQLSEKRKRRQELDAQLNARAGPINALKPRSRESLKDPQGIVCRDEDVVEHTKAPGVDAFSRNERGSPRVSIMSDPPSKGEQTSPSSPEKSEESAIAEVIPQAGERVIPESDTEEQEEARERGPSSAKHTVGHHIQEHGKNVEEHSTSLLDRMGKGLSKFPGFRRWRRTEEQGEEKRETVAKARLGTSESQPLEIDDDSPPRRKPYRSSDEISVSHEPDVLESPSRGDRLPCSQLHSRYETTHLRTSFQRSSPAPKMDSDILQNLPSTPGLMEPYVNSSALSTPVMDLSKSTKDPTNDDDEMLLARQTPIRAKSTHRRSSSPMGLPPANLEVTHKRQAPSQGPDQNKRMKSELSGQETT